MYDDRMSHRKYIFRRRVNVGEERELFSLDITRSKESRINPTPCNIISIDAAAYFIAAGCKTFLGFVLRACVYKRDLHVVLA